MLTGRSRSSRIIFAFLMFLLGLNACNPVTATQPVVQVETPLPEASPTPPANLAEITFAVTLLQPAPDAQKIYVDILDEVTGLAITPERHPLTSAGKQRYTATVPVPIGTAIKYRYSREGKPAPVEYNCIGQQVRYRLFLVGGTDTVPDVICAWNDQPVETTHGRIAGTVQDGQGGQPLADILVTAAGASTLTSADGSYLLENLPPGKHNLVFYSLDGRYQPYQQGAVIATEATTPASVGLAPARMVKVEFLASVPEASAEDLPVRLVGNLLQLGNTFSDLSGGISTVAYRSVPLERQRDGSYGITLELPAGLDLRYKYTLGDGFWNGELDATGGFLTRQLIVPQQDTKIEDEIINWQGYASGAVTFTVTVPANTPPEDTVSIQFSGFGWTEPIPMWPRGENTWNYVLYNPHHLMPTVQYRYCRNEQCSIADDAATAGPASAGRSFTPGAKSQTLRDKVENWTGLAELEPSAPEKIEITRSGAFWSGVEIQPKYDPTWPAHDAQAFQSIRDLNAGWVVMTPSWQYTSINPPVLEGVPGQTQLFSDVKTQIVTARRNHLHAALFPRVSGPITTAKVWQEARLDSDWWQRWFERYRVYALHFADLAEASGAEALILEGDHVRPAYPGTLEYSHKPTNLPGDAGERWQALLTEIRERYHGQLLWSVRYNGRLAAVPEFIDAVDQVYLLWSAPLAARAKTTEKDMLKTVATVLKRDIQPLQKRLNKPILLAVAYPSAQGAVTGCIKVGESCLPFDSFNQPFTPNKQFKADLNGQSIIYRAILKGISKKEYHWISGLVSRGYYPAASMQDLSLSIYGKPAQQTLTQWFAALQKIQ